MKFFSFSNPRPVIPVSSGFAEQPVFMEKIDDEGHTFLDVVSMTNVYDKIQASRDACNINNIVRRLGGVENVSAAYPQKGQFIDVVGMPTSLIEAQKILTKFETDFSKLSSDVRKKFNNNPFEFVAYADAVLSGQINNENPIQKDIDSKEGE